MPPRNNAEPTPPPVIPPIEQVLPTHPRDLRRTPEQREHAASFERACRDIGHRLVASAAKIVGPDAAEDVVQEALVKGWSHLHLYQDRGKGLAPWLQTITHNTAINVYNRRGRLRRHEVPSVDLSAADAAAAAKNYRPPNSAEVLALGAKGNRVVIEALARCGQQNRSTAAQMKVVYLVHILGYSAEAAAEALDMPKGTVMSQASRGRAKLRALIESGEIAL